MPAAFSKKRNMKRKTYTITPARPAHIHAKKEVPEGCRPTAIAAAITATAIIAALANLTMAALAN